MLHVTQAPFRENHHQRVESMERSLRGDLNSLKGLCWNADYADRVLRESAIHRVYDAQHYDR
jgi:hypothetical protein